jgi:hypothetical protein
MEDSIYWNFYYNYSWIQLIITAHNRWLPKTCSIPYWTTNVFSSIVTELVLIYEWANSSDSVVLSLTLPSWTLNFWILLRMTPRLRMIELRQSQSHVTTDDQSASLSWNKAPIWDLRPDFYYCQTVAGLLMWDALSDERTGLSFTIAPGPCQCRHFRVRLPWYSWP